MRRSRALPTVVAGVGPVRRAMKLRLEPIEHGADDRRANRLQKFLGALNLVEIGASGADDQKNRIHHAREEQRIVGRQNRRRVPRIRSRTLAKWI